MGFEAGALTLVLIFGANAVLAVSLWALHRYKAVSSSPYSENGSSGGSKPAAHGKQLSEALELTLKSVTSLSTELLRLGCVILISYVCEKYPIFPHAKKVSTVKN